jgi:hypothetical protein
MVDVNGHYIAATPSAMKYWTTKVNRRLCVMVMGVVTIGAAAG